MSLTPVIDAPAHVGEAPSLKERIRLFLADAGLTRSESWVRTVYRDYVRVAVPGTPIGMFVATRIALSIDEARHVSGRPDLRYLLTYADPTGETAARNVDRERMGLS